MSKIYKINGEDYVFMKGASEYMVKACSHFHDVKNNKIIPIDKALTEKLSDSINHMATQSLRTIGLCYKKLSQAIDKENTDK